MPLSNTFLRTALPLLLLLTACADFGPEEIQPTSASSAASSQTSAGADGDDAAHAQTAAAAPALPTTEEDAIDVFFTPFDDVESEVLAELAEAREELLVAHYNIRRQPILDLLVELSRRGVDVRVAVDDKNARNDWNRGDDFLEANGVELVRVRMPHAYGIMHLKVAVIDRHTVLTGSFNWNTTAAMANDENMLVIRDATIAGAYADEVEELLGDRPRSVDGGPQTGDVALHFAPEEALDDIIVAELSAATESIELAMFILTEWDIGRALLDAVGRGVEVTLVIEDKMHHYSSLDERLEERGARVIRGANTITGNSAMHDKYCVIDGEVVLTGAVNWTHTGTTRSEEDLLVLTSPAVVARYEDSFRDLVHVYGAEDDGEAPRGYAPAFFHAICDSTVPGDTLVVVGDRPEVGMWNPRAGLPLDTTAGFFPDWSARTSLRAGGALQFKLVILHADGRVTWEPGPNRILPIPSTGRAVVVTGEFGDTSATYTPADQPSAGE